MTYLCGQYYSRSSWNRDIKKKLIFCWQLVARNAGIAKDFILSVILEYYLINYVKFSAIYVLTTSPFVSDNRVLLRKIGRRVAGEYPDSSKRGE